MEELGLAHGLVQVPIELLLSQLVEGAHDFHDALELDWII